MRRLVADMVQDNPQQRPDMDAVAARFAEIRTGLSQATLRSRPALKSEFFIASAVRDVMHWRRQLSDVLNGRPPLLPPTASARDS